MTITKCDHCGVVLDQSIGKRYAVESPDGWFHFCNYNCMSGWLRRKFRANAETE